MQEEKVWIQRPGPGGAIGQVLRSEIPPGFELTAIPGFGRVYSAPLAVTGSEPLLWPSFPAIVQKSVRRLARVLAPVDPWTAAEWELYFRRHPCPWESIADCELWAAAYRRFTAQIKGRGRAAKEKRNEVFRAIFAPSDHVASQRNVDPVDRAAQELPPSISDWLDSQWYTGKWRKRTEELRELLDPLPARVTVGQLFDEDGRPNPAAGFDVRDLIRRARVIVALDTDTEAEVVVFREFVVLCESAYSKAPDCILRVELDLDTNDLPQLQQLVHEVMGRLGTE
jgi:hypothetical protein